MTPTARYKFENYGIQEHKVETDEIISKLCTTQHGKLVKLLLEDRSCYTKKGRLNKSAAARAMGVKVAIIDRALTDLQDALYDMGIYHL